MGGGCNIMGAFSGGGGGGGAGVWTELADKSVTGVATITSDAFTAMRYLKVFLAVYDWDGTGNADHIVQLDSVTASNYAVMEIYGNGSGGADWNQRINQDGLYIISGGGIPTVNTFTEAYVYNEENVEKLWISSSCRSQQVGSGYAPTAAFYFGKLDQDAQVTSLHYDFTGGGSVTGTADARMIIWGSD